jgi:hypothetical protein
MAHPGLAGAANGLQARRYGCCGRPSWLALAGDTRAVRRHRTVRPTANRHSHPQPLPGWVNRASRASCHCFLSTTPPPFPPAIRARRGASKSATRQSSLPLHPTARSNPASARALQIRHLSAIEVNRSIHGCVALFADDVENYEVNHCFGNKGLIVDETE